MPDWSYHTLFKPVLFRLPPSSAKGLTLKAVSFLGSVPGGTALIDFMGQMAPDSTNRYEKAGITFPARVGLGAGLSINRGALKSFERFGFAFIEVGPISMQAGFAQKGLERNLQEESITCEDKQFSETFENFTNKHLPTKETSIPLFVRLTHIEGSSPESAYKDLTTLHESLPSWVAAIVVETQYCLQDWDEEKLDEYLSKLSKLSRCMILAICPDTNKNYLEKLLRLATKNGIAGISISGGIKDPNGTNRRIFGNPTLPLSLQVLRTVREQAPQLLIIGCDGIIEPADSLAMLDAGADLVAVHSGLVYSGPCLAKRINELITAFSTPQINASLSTSAPPYSMSGIAGYGWLGFAVVGAGLMITGACAITVALTTVILPYDESFLGLSRAAMVQINKNLLPFLSHDRVTYAGAGMSCGLLFACLSCFGARLGQLWAYKAARLSCGFGFCSFFLFLGFHYLDPLHTLATLLMLPFFIWGLLKPPTTRPMRSSNMHNNKSWHDSLVGQFWFVCIGLGLLLAGITICQVGTSTVFVKEDLLFMHTSASELLCHNNHLLPTIAHDRAGFGGALVTCGFGVLLTALHGFRQGEGWVWWMLLISGLPGFLSTLGIHYFIGYTNWFHLLPAYLATAMFLAGLSLSYRYLCCEPGPETIIPKTLKAAGDL